MSFFIYLCHVAKTAATRATPAARAIQSTFECSRSRTDSFRCNELTLFQGWNWRTHKEGNTPTAGFKVTCVTEYVSCTSEVSSLLSTCRLSERWLYAAWILDGLRGVSTSSWSPGRLGDESSPLLMIYSGITDDVGTGVLQTGHNDTRALFCDHRKRHDQQNRCPQRVTTGSLTESRQMLQENLDSSLSFITRQETRNVFN
jgi:hypothetical protein